MATVPELAKRNRSKPGDWWAAAPDRSGATPPQRTELPPKKRVRISDSSFPEQATQNSTAFGNRSREGNPTDSVARDQEPGNELEGEDEAEKARPPRRGRSSGGEKKSMDLSAAATTNKGGDKGVKKKRREVSKAKEVDAVDEIAPKKRGHSAASLSEDLSETIVSPEVQVLRKKGPKHTRSREERNAVDVLEGQAAPKKRGRPAASQPEESSMGEDPSQNPRPVRRGRSSNTEAELQASSSYKETETVKLGQSSNAEAETRPVVVPVLTSGDGNYLRRGRSSNTEAELRVAVIYKETKTRNGPRSSNTEPEIQASEAPSSSDQVSRRKKERRRPQETEEDVVERTANQSATSKKRKRRSENDTEVQTASSKLSKNRAGSKKAIRPVVATASGTRGSSNTQGSRKPNKRTRQPDADAIEDAGLAPSQALKKKPQHSSQVRPKPRNQEEAHKPNVEPHGAKRRGVGKASLEETEPRQLKRVPSYQHLAAVTHRVSRNTIEAKWNSLPPTCIERVSQLLQDIQRAVVARLNDERRRTQTSTALQIISRRLVGKISKGLPFPQGTSNQREDDFDFEKILDHNRGLEAQLTPALHANELLKAELSKEMALLETETANLAELSANAKTEASKRKGEARKMHSFLQTRDSLTEKDDIGFIMDEFPTQLNPSMQGDKILGAVIKDLQGHVDSLEGNMKQVKGITQAMAKSKAAVQATLFGHLDSTQYEAVVLG